MSFCHAPYNGSVRHRDLYWRCCQYLDSGQWDNWLSYDATVFSTISLSMPTWTWSPCKWRLFCPLIPTPPHSKIRRSYLTNYSRAEHPASIIPIIHFFLNSDSCSYYLRWRRNGMSILAFPLQRFKYVQRSSAFYNLWKTKFGTLEWHYVVRNHVTFLIIWVSARYVPLAKFRYNLIIISWWADFFGNEYMNG